jgi:hypothetical protein
LEVRRVKSRE